MAEAGLAGDLDEIDSLLFDQEAFTELAHRMIADLGLSDEYGEDSAGGEGEEEGEQEEELESDTQSEACNQTIRPRTGDPKWRRWLTAGTKNQTNATA